MRVLDLGLGFSFDVGVGRGRQAVGLVDGRRLGLLLLLRVGIGGSSTGIKFVDPLNDAVEFILQALVGADVEIAAQQRVERVVEILLGLIRFACLLVGQPSFVFFFRTSDERCDRIGSGDAGW